MTSRQSETDDTSENFTSIGKRLVGSSGLGERKILALLLKRRFYERSNANIGKHDNKINKTE